jgi:hypothetical protein
MTGDTWSGWSRREPALPRRTLNGVLMMRLSERRPLCTRLAEAV